MTGRGKPGGARRAVEEALARLGMHAGARQVVAYLAGLGVRVSERLVNGVRIDLLKTTDAVRRWQSRLPQAVGRPAAYARRKTLPRR